MARGHDKWVLDDEIYTLLSETISASNDSLLTEENYQLIVNFLCEIPTTEKQIVIEILGLRDGVSKTARELDKKIKISFSVMICILTQPYN